MSLKYLGAGFDVHGGGRDLIFPHHENEVAQVEAAAHPFARFWMHNGMLNLREEKMSKSVGNILTLRHILDEHRPEALIAAFVGTHYRSPLEFSAELLTESEQQVDRLRNLFRALADRVAAADGGVADGVAADGASLQDGGGPVDAATIDDHLTERRRAFDEALADDLNTAAALAEVFGVAREVNAALAAGDLGAAPAAEVRNQMADMVYVLGLDAVTRIEGAIPAEVTAMAEERQLCRSMKNFARADELRAAITECGYEVRDVAGGFKLVPTR